MKKTTQLFLALALLGPFGRPATAEIAVIVDDSVPVDAVSIDQLQRLYLDKARRSQTASQLTPIDQKKGSAIRQEFSRKVLGKSERELASYWSRLMFSGKGRPPRQYDDDAEVIDQVTGNPGTVGYIDAASVKENTRVLLRIP